MFNEGLDVTETQIDESGDEDEKNEEEEEKEKEDEIDEEEKDELFLENKAREYLNKERR